jgi:hypothetical protein
VDPCTQWYAAKRTSLLILWTLGSLVLGIFALYVNWKFAVLWSLVAILGFVVLEKLLMRRVDQAAPR